MEIHATVYNKTYTEINIVIMLLVSLGKQSLNCSQNSWFTIKSTSRVQTDYICFQVKNIQLFSLNNSNQKDNRITSFAVQSK